MRMYYIFNVKKDIANIYQNNPSSLYKVLESIYYMHQEEVDYGFNIFKQITNRIKVLELNKIGTILLDNEYKIINDYQIDDEIPFDGDFFLITEYPEKIRKRYFHSTKSDY